MPIINYKHLTILLTNSRKGAHFDEHLAAKWPLVMVLLLDARKPRVLNERGRKRGKKRRLAEAAAAKQEHAATLGRLHRANITRHVHDEDDEKAAPNLQRDVIMTARYMSQGRLLAHGDIPNGY